MGTYEVFSRTALALGTGSEPPAPLDRLWEGLEAFSAYVYGRKNPRGWHLEWWLHVGGCRRLLKLVRHTLTHEIRWVGNAQDPAWLPQEPGR